MSVPVPSVSVPDLITPEPWESGANVLVTERFDNATQYADMLITTATEILNQLGDTDFVIDWEGVTWTTIPRMGLDSLDKISPPWISVEDIIVDIPPFTGTEPTVQDITIDDTPVPDPSYGDPGFSIPEPPVVEWPIFDDEAPTIRDPDIPAAPVITLPPVPSIDDVSIPAPPAYNVPEFEGELPVDDLTPPEPMFVWNEAEYDSDIRQKLAEKLYDNLVTGGSGLDEETEQAIYDRAIARQEQENTEIYDNALNYFASRNHVIPPGALSSALIEADRKIAQIREDLNNDILVNQSKLAQENTHFIIDRAIQNEKNLMDYTNQFQQRAFDAAKYVVEAALIIYSGKIEAYKAKIAAYGALAEVYKARVTGEIAKAEFYKAQIEGIRASVDVKRALVDAYAAQIAAINTYIELYKTQMEAANVQALIDRTRVESFTALVQAYTARVAAVTERYRGYQAQIAGEAAKADMFRAQVQAYESQVNAYRASAEVDVARANVALSVTRSRTEVYRSLIDKYVADVNAAVEEARTQAAIEGVKIDNFRAQAGLYQAEIDTTVRLFAGLVEEARANLQLQLQESDIAVREALGRQQIIQENMRAAGSMSAQLGAAALGAVSASAHIQYGDQRTDSRGYSATQQGIGQALGQASNIHQEIHQYIES